MWEYFQTPKCRLYTMCLHKSLSQLWWGLQYTVYVYKQHTYPSKSSYVTTRKHTFGLKSNKSKKGATEMYPGAHDPPFIQEMNQCQLEKKSLKKTRMKSLVTASQSKVQKLAKKRNCVCREVRGVRETIIFQVLKLFCDTPLKVVRFYEQIFPFTSSFFVSEMVKYAEGLLIPKKLRILGVFKVFII